MAFDRQRIYHKRDRLRQLRAFCYAAQFESITRSAEHLAISQPAVSLHVRELEHEVEALLFDRIGPRVALTPAGRCLHRLAMPLVQAMDCLGDTFTGKADEPVSGEIRVAAGPSAIAFVLPPYFKRFRDEHPEVRVQVTSCAVNAGLNLLSARDVDLVIGTEMPETETFSFHPAFSGDLVLITPEAHPLAGRESVDIEEAAQYPRDSPARGYLQPAVRGFHRPAIRGGGQCRGRGERLGGDQAVCRGWTRHFGRPQPLPHRERPGMGHSLCPLRGEP